MGNISVGGTLTYQDVTNVDSVGMITARSGLEVVTGGADLGGQLREKVKITSGKLSDNQGINPIMDIITLPLLKPQQYHQI